MGIPANKQSRTKLPNFQDSANLWGPEIAAASPRILDGLAHVRRPRKGPFLAAGSLPAQRPCARRRRTGLFSAGQVTGAARRRLCCFMARIFFVMNIRSIVAPNAEPSCWWCDSSLYEQYIRHGVRHAAVETRKRLKVKGWRGWCWVLANEIW